MSAEALLRRNLLIYGAGGIVVPFIGIKIIDVIITMLEARMNITRNLVVAILMTIVTTLLLGIVYPLVVTGIAQAVFPDKANGQLIQRDGKFVGSRIIGQAFSSPAYFAAGRRLPALVRCRHSAARTWADEQEAHRRGQGWRGRRADGECLGPGADRPGDLVCVRTRPACVACVRGVQVPRVARERGVSVADVERLVDAHTEGRQFGFLGEPVVNVLELNLALDTKFPKQP